MTRTDDLLLHLLTEKKNTQVGGGTTATPTIAGFSPSPSPLQWDYIHSQFAHSDVGQQFLQDDLLLVVSHQMKAHLRKLLLPSSSGIIPAELKAKLRETPMAESLSVSGLERVERLVADASSTVDHALCNRSVGSPHTVSQLRFTRVLLAITYQVIDSHLESLGEEEANNKTTTTETEDETLNLSDEQNAALDKLTRTVRVLFTTAEEYFILMSSSTASSGGHNHTGTSNGVGSIAGVRCQAEVGLLLLAILQQADMVQLTAFLHSDSVPALTTSLLGHLFHWMERFSGAAGGFMISAEKKAAAANSHSSAEGGPAVMAKASGRGFFNLYGLLGGGSGGGAAAGSNFGGNISTMESPELSKLNGAVSLHILLRILNGDKALESDTNADEGDRSSSSRHDDPSSYSTSAPPFRPAMAAIVRLTAEGKLDLKRLVAGLEKSIVNAPSLIILLYVLLLDHPSFLGFCFQSPQLPGLVLNICRMLYEHTKSLGISYLTLASLHLLAQDKAFVKATQRWSCTPTGWYTDRHLGPMSVGSLIIIVSLRVVASTAAADKSLELAFMATGLIANLAPFTEKLDAYASQRMVVFVQLLSSRMIRGAAIINNNNNNSTGGGGNSRSSSGGGRSAAAVRPPQQEAVTSSSAAVEAPLTLLQLELLIPLLRSISIMATRNDNTTLVYELLYHQDKLFPSELVAATKDAPSSSSGTGEGLENKSSASRSHHHRAPVQTELCFLRELVGFYEAEIASISVAHSADDILSVIHQHSPEACQVFGHRVHLPGLGVSAEANPNNLIEGHFSGSKNASSSSATTTTVSTTGKIPLPEADHLAFKYQENAHAADFLLAFSYSRLATLDLGAFYWGDLEQEILKL